MTIVRTTILALSLVSLTSACGGEAEDICDNARTAVENCDESFGTAEEAQCQAARDACSDDDEERAANALACLSGKECTSASVVACSGELEGISSECQQAVFALVPN